MNATAAAHTEKFGHTAVDMILLRVYFNWTETSQSSYKLTKVDRCGQHTPSKQMPNKN